MKRDRGLLESSNGGAGAIASLQQMVLCAIVEPFGNSDAAFAHYCTVAGALRPHVASLLADAWAQRKESGGTLLCTKRRVTRLRLSVEYVDTRALLADGAAVSSVRGTMCVPVHCELAQDVLRAAHLKNQAGAAFEMTRSKHHRAPRFILH